MFEDEAGFGRINKPKYCWCFAGVRPNVPCHHIREYRYVYGAVEPGSGESFFYVMPYCNTDCMNLYLDQLSKAYANDHILLIADGAAWHKSETLVTPEKEIRKLGFRNEVFETLAKVVDRLCETIRSLTPDTIKSITGRSWILALS
jgi:hypothetical protein